MHGRMGVTITHHQHPLSSETGKYRFAEHEC
jgi:hypothetical protein